VNFLVSVMGGQLTIFKGSEKNYRSKNIIIVALILEYEFVDLTEGD